MLDQTSYLFAIYVYVGAACLILVCLAWWLGRRWGAAWTAFAVLLAAALLLTPAYPRPGMDTMAPALIVAGFRFFTEGYDAAGHALRPLAFMCGGAVLMSLLLGLTLLRRRRG
ncbi:MAG: hypothetical protein U5K56_02175 [Halioglobus sp.]|nr:hypothetical protein [Halioglobus sp.]